MKNKRKILMIMFALVVIMGIGFAAYSQQLRINDTSSIDSNWNVYIKEVSVPSKTSGATGSSTVDEVEKLKAELTTDLKYPGDYVIYNIIVANDGTIDAILEKINFSMEKEDTVINYYYSVDDQTTWNKVAKNGENPYNEDLLANTTDEFQVKVEYDPTKTGTATKEQKSNKLTLNLDYAQKTGGEIIEPENNIVYRNTSDNLKIGDSIEGISTTTNPTTLGKSYYIKHDIDSEKKIIASYVCFVAEKEYCIQGGDATYYESNKALLVNKEEWFKNNGGSCDNGGIYIRCNGGGFSPVDAYSDGGVGTYTSGGFCFIGADAGAYCS